MNEFKEVMDEMALVDIKPDSGWFTWVNNRDKGRLIKERLDRFLTSVAVVENFPFIATKVLRQTQSDHDAIILDLWGRKPKDFPKDKRLCFKFDVCWVGNKEAKNVIDRAWNSEGTDYGEKWIGFDRRSVHGNNNIERLKDAEGNWVTNSKEICKVAKDYFVSLFRSNSQNANIQEMGHIKECVTRETNERLNMIYTEEEITQAIKQMDPNKAPGIDGL
ncbi:uncharacterized protein LOC105767067 [Gossypium raimondii]|uniref:uncharacterized protein LOC105767067 n=1 Tax=Gossypium raimondii TaxID=29730 RepID=UPI00063B0779|nr:uncharacterized protein LOC105767067 [Gossypium raimondii]